MAGVYAFINQCIRDPLYPHAPLIKIGRGIISDRYKSARKNEGTYLPCPYEIICAKECENDAQWETHLHKIFAPRIYRPPYGTGLGTEFFRNLTPEEVRLAMEEIPGTWYEPPQVKQTDEIVQSRCIEMRISDSQEFLSVYGTSASIPCGPHEVYDWLHPNTKKLSQDEFGQRVFIEAGIRTTRDYEEFAKNSNLPSLIQIQDGYFGMVGFRDMLEKYAPTRNRR